MSNQNPEYWLTDEDIKQAAAVDSDVYGDPSQLDVKDVTPYVQQLHQVHRAKRHYDVRLGKGKMMSWTTRKELPKPGDKPIALFPQPLHDESYSKFQGRIQTGYGAGTVRPVDRGDVQVTHASPDKIKFRTSHKETPEDYTLVRMKAKDGKKPVWLMINNTQIPGIENPEQLDAQASKAASLMKLACVGKSAALVEDRDPDLNMEHRRFNLQLDGRTIGRATASKKARANNTVEVTDLYVDPAYRGQGIASQLIDRIRDEHKSATLCLKPQPFADKLLSRDELVHVYEKLGFELRPGRRNEMTSDNYKSAMFKMGLEAAAAVSPSLDDLSRAALSYAPTQATSSPEPIMESPAQLPEAGKPTAVVKSSVPAANPVTPVVKPRATGSQSQFTPEQIYASISSAETNKSSPFIRTTVKPAGGSTAYGPVQITGPLLQDIIKKYSNLFDSPELEYLKGLHKQSLEFKRHGGMKGKLPDYNPDFDYGGKGNMGDTPEQRALYESAMKKFMGHRYNTEANRDIKKFMEMWRGEPQARAPGYYNKVLSDLRYGR